MTVKSLNRVKCATATTGTGTATVGSALSSFLTPDDAGAVNGGKYKTLWEDGSDWEISKSTYTTSGATLTRTLVKSSTGSLLNLSGTATVAFISDADDENGGRALSAPQGRLTLTTGVPVLASSVTAATTIYYTPHEGNRAPIPDKDGFGLVMREFSELSQATTDNTKSPAAAAAYSCYDMLLWDDAGTLRCTRGAQWSKANTFTVTIATPAVFTCNSHGLKEGDVIYLTTTGALPTGLSTATAYFIIAAGLTANAFEVSASLNGAAVNTSGSQSGTHTQTCYMIDRGTGAGTAQISRGTDGFYTNTVAVTNGPGAGLGLYVGTIITDGSSQVNVILGGVGGAGGEGCIVGVWNAYNRALMRMLNFDNTNSWTTTSATFLLKNANALNITSMVVGLQTDAVFGTTSAVASHSGTSDRRISWGHNSSTTAIVGSPIGYMPNLTANYGANASFSVVPNIGSQRFYPLELTAGATATWLGDNNSTTLYTGTIVNVWA